jgi:hypothetical protein
MDRQTKMSWLFSSMCPWYQRCLAKSSRRRLALECHVMHGSSGDQTTVECAVTPRVRREPTLDESLRISLSKGCVCGFLTHCMLQDEEIEIHVVDPALIATSRPGGHVRETVTTALARLLIKLAGVHMSPTTVPMDLCRQWLTRVFRRTQTSVTLVDRPEHRSAPSGLSRRSKFRRPRSGLREDEASGEWIMPERQGSA